MYVELVELVRLSEILLSACIRNHTVDNCPKWQYVLHHSLFVTLIDQCILYSVYVNFSGTFCMECRDVYTDFQIAAVTFCR